MSTILYPLTQSAHQDNTRSHVVSRVLASAVVRRCALVIGFAALTALLAQLRVYTTWSPVPITGQTLGVLVAGSALGWKLGSASQLLYVSAGLFLPVYTDGNSGWSYVQGATGGYLFGFVVVSALVGLLAERKQDRNVLTSLPMMLFGSAVIYVFGATWLAHVAHLPAQKAIAKGVAPFLLGDALKSVLAGVAFPIAWSATKNVQKTFKG